MFMNTGQLVFIIFMPVVDQESSLENIYWNLMATVSVSVLQIQFKIYFCMAIFHAEVVIQSVFPFIVCI
jgi:hypothetical protein